MSAAPPFDWRSISARVLFAMLLVFAVYNPSGRFSYWHWLISGEGPTWALLAVGAVLLGMLGFVTRTIRRILRAFATLLIIVFCVSVYVGLSLLGLMDGLAGESIAVGVLTTYAVLIAAALCFSPLQHRLAGIVHARAVID
jgi:hypothetical protein